MAEKTRSFTDPIHGKIHFDKSNPIEKLALDIIDTQAFQRLRSIRQLGTAALVFPSANHTRFNHCIGTAHIAREMCNVVDEQGLGDKNKSDVTFIAALLHDIGHGPYSHNFEHISQHILKLKKSHEEWGTDIITKHPPIRDLLEGHKKGFSKEVASFLTMDKKDRDLYPSIISGSLDADRMDYLMRDRHSCGIDGSSINKRQIIDSLEVAEFENGRKGFVIKANGQTSVEGYLRARVDLYKQVYNSKYEIFYYLSLEKFIESVVKKPELLDDKYSPLEKFMKGDQSLDNYLQMTDSDFNRLVNRMSECKDKNIARLAQDVMERNPEKRAHKCIDLSLSIVSHPENADLVRQIFKKNKNIYIQDKLLKTYDPQSMPIYIKDTRANNQIYELSEVTESAIHQDQKRLFRVYIERDKHVELQNGLGLFYNSIMEKKR